MTYTDAHQPAGVAYAAHLLDHREQAQTAAVEKVIIGHGGASWMD
jgi:hypothetical protein